MRKLCLMAFTLFLSGMAATAGYECRIGEPHELRFKRVTLEENGLGITISYERRVKKKEQVVPEVYSYKAHKALSMQKLNEQSFAIENQGPQNELVKWELKIFKAELKISALLRRGAHIQKFSNCKTVP